LGTIALHTTLVINIKSEKQLYYTSNNKLDIR
jgi:hypothetical protein